MSATAFCHGRTKYQPSVRVSADFMWRSVSICSQCNVKIPSNNSLNRTAQYVFVDIFPHISYDCWWWYGKGLEKISDLSSLIHEFSLPATVAGLVALICPSAGFISARWSLTYRSATVRGITCFASLCVFHFILYISAAYHSTLKYWKLGFASSRGMFLCCISLMNRKWVGSLWPYIIGELYVWSHLLCRQNHPLKDCRWYC